MLLRYVIFTTRTIESNTMAKRKAKDLEDGALAEEPRRSSRRVSTAEDEVIPEKKSKKSKPAPVSKPAKKVQKPAKAVPAVARDEESKSSDIVGSPNALPPYAPYFL